MDLEMDLIINKTVDRTEHDLLLEISQSIDRLGGLLSRQDVVDLFEKNKERFPTLYPDIVQLLRSITTASANDDGRWNALAPWNR